MLTIDELTGIPDNKRREAQEILDDLMTFRDEDGSFSPMISGYNWYNRLADSDRVITLSHIHETEEYKEAMFKDLEKLGYSREDIIKRIRDKAGAFLWNPKFEIRSSNGEIYPGLRIRSLKNNSYLNLEDFVSPIANDPEFLNVPELLVAEDEGWQLDFPFRNKGELLRLIKLFTTKTVADLEGSWADAYETPVLLLGEASLKYQKELVQFSKVKRFSLIEGGNEISFIIHNELERLKRLPHYSTLQDLGFSEEDCLANNPFLRYIDAIS